MGEPMVPYRHDVIEAFDLEIRWVHVPCLYGPEICELRHHVAAVANVIGTDSWCGIVHGAPQHSPQQEDEIAASVPEDWAAYQRAAVAFGMRWAELTPAHVLAQLTLAISMSEALWDELMLWDLEAIPLMVRRGKGDLYVAPQLLRCTGWYRSDVGGSNRAVSVMSREDGEDDVAEWGDDSR